MKRSNVAHLFVCSAAPVGDQAAQIVVDADLCRVNVYLVGVVRWRTVGRADVMLPD